jgi:hypothetical protein
MDAAVQPLSIRTPFSNLKKHKHTRVNSGQQVPPDFPHDFLFPHPQPHE